MRVSVSCLCAPLRGRVLLSIANCVRRESLVLRIFLSFSGLGFRISSAASKTKALVVLCNRLRNEPKACAPAGARRVIFFLVVAESGI